MDFYIESGLNPRGVLDFSPLYLFSKGIFKWQVSLFELNLNLLSFLSEFL